MNFEGLEQYLNIDNTKYNTPSLDALNYYLKQYMLTVPFENIDVQNGVKISVEVEDIYNKVVNHQRGGFCYEMNNFFKAYLEHKGFTVNMFSATIHTPGGGRSLKGSHMSLIVPIDGVDYVSDVGFGDLPLSVMPITQEDNSTIIHDINGDFRAIYVNDNLFYIQKWKEDDWDTQYEAELTPRHIHDFDYNIEYNQTNPNSTFVKRLLVTMPKSYGRATMSQDNLTLTKQQKKEKYDVTSENYRQFLKEEFNLDVKIDRLES
ncbi:MULTISPECIES: arylamine N-acetyltransferase [Staphylococcus]|uniref:arylamine N-acetyltransferase n=1 Tax=Staphylococcus TaxID=1279 RepID=UPI000319E601|nr:MULTISPECIES: arylamine N-acetyltransferase [Staphylococcus]MBM6506179.1 arylamine N-acetyltransferase [Staphylococcus pasteuri]MCT1926764.1 arylamine N-acetyltransferase [Staphylococcus pasteuri]PTU81402.1 arylamine N-acetyltransferase [Staphylococcus pasteuri]PTU83765.1 arylamine N-acetyltransferase [Staphylococcus pasteuri]QQT10364.1 arylamine N-acetyltransferase [Staphylococcus pasteuri]